MADTQGDGDTQIETLSNGHSALASQRAATLAALEAGEHLSDEKPAEEKPATSEDEEEDETEDVEDESDDDEESDDSESDEDEDDSEDDDEGKVEAKDPDLAKRLTAVRKAERRSKELIAKERATFERERDQFISEWKPKIEAAEKFEALKAGVRYKAVDVLRELGLPEDDFEDVARELYAFSKKGAEDPKNKEAAIRSRRERELVDEVRELKKWRDDKEASEKRREAESKVERETQAWITKVTKRIDDDQPLLKRLAATSESDVARFIAAAATSLIDELGMAPSPKRTIARAEKLYRKELRRLGVDPDAVVKAPTSLSKADKAAVKKAVPTKKVEADAKAETAPKTLREQRAETLRLIEEGKLD